MCGIILKVIRSLFGLTHRYEILISLCFYVIVAELKMETNFLFGFVECFLSTQKQYPSDWAK